jgi:hypothetical protein
MKTRASVLDCGDFSAAFESPRGLAHSKTLQALQIGAEPFSLLYLDFRLSL